MSAWDKEIAEIREGYERIPQLKSNIDRMDKFDDLAEKLRRIEAYVTKEKQILMNDKSRENLRKTYKAERAALKSIQVLGGRHRRGTRKTRRVRRPTSSRRR